MQYFDSLPKMVHINEFGVSKVMTNIMARVSIIPQILNNPAIYYEYDIQDSDTPEIIAHKYYGDSYRYWLVMFANQLMDPQWDWPLSGNELSAYLVKKYGENYNTYSEIHHYEKILTQFDYGTNTTTTNKVTVSEDIYNAIVPQTNYFSLPTGDVSIAVDKSAVSVYDYELDLNEQKRNIKILNADYVNKVEEEFKKLMVN
tara:strand:+ start:1440 stop:2042 length:603 start_codon:yes stop_codon:yes gene_type:complete